MSNQLLILLTFPQSKRPKFLVATSKKKEKQTHNFLNKVSLSPQSERGFPSLWRHHLRQLDESFPTVPAVPHLHPLIYTVNK